MTLDVVGRLRDIFGRRWMSLGQFLDVVRCLWGSIWTSFDDSKRRWTSGAIFGRRSMVSYVVGRLWMVLDVVR